MFGLNAAVRVDFATKPAGMRKSLDGLAARASGGPALDPLFGHLFVVVNVTIVADLILSIIASQPHLEPVLSKGRRFAVTRGFDPQTLHRLIAAVEEHPCLD